MTDFGSEKKFDWGREKAGHQENLGEAKPLQDFPDAPPEFYEEMKEILENKLPEFKDWSRYFIDNFYQSSKEQKTPNTQYSFHDPVQQKLEAVFPNDSGYYTKEKALAISVFFEELISFIDSKIHSDHFSKEDFGFFMGNLYKTFFNKSPDLLDNLNVDIVSKLILASKIKETYGLQSIVDTQGGLSYDLSFSSEIFNDETFEEIINQKTSDKLSLIKEIFSVAMSSYGNGSWAEQGFLQSVDLLKRIRQEDTNPIIRFFCDSKLHDIQNSIDHKLDDGVFGNRENKNINIRPSLAQETEDFFKKASIIPELPKTYFSQVSRDYGAVISSVRLNPVTLVSVSKETLSEIRDNNFTQDKLDEIYKALDFFHSESFNMDKEIFILSLVDEIQDEGLKVDFSNLGNVKNKIEDSLEKFNKIINIESKMKEVESKIFLEIENENGSKSKEIFDFIDNNIDEIFTGDLINLKEKWLHYKDRGNDDGLFDIVETISIRQKDFSRIFSENDDGWADSYEKLRNKKEEDLTIHEKIALMKDNLGRFFIENWESLNKRVDTTTLNFRNQILEINQEIKKVLEDIDYDRIISSIEKSLQDENHQRKVFHVKSYEDILNDNSIDPFSSGTTENKKEFSHILKMFHSPEIRMYINSEFDITIENFDLREQLQFLRFLSTSDDNKFDRIKNILKKDNFENMYFFKSFLSMSGDSSMGDKILTLGDKLPQESAGILFQTYSAMVDATDDVEQLLQDNLKERITPELIQETKNSLLVSGKKLLETYADKISVCEGEDCQKISEDLKDKLSLAKRSVFAFSSACKTLVEKGKFSFEDFQKAKLYYERAPLAENIKSQIIAMHTENTKQYPDALREKWRETLRDGLEKENNKQLVVYVQYEDNVVSAMRILQKEDGSSYGASFNVNPTIQGSKVGSELLKKVLFDLAKDKPFIADCYSKNPMLQTYLNTFGFQITKEIENYENTGELVYEITLFPQKEN